LTLHALARGKPRLTYANVMFTIAMFLARGGGAVRAVARDATISPWWMTGAQARESRPGRGRALGLLALAVALIALGGPQIARAADSVYWSDNGSGGTGYHIAFARLDGSGGGDLNTSGATLGSPRGAVIDVAAGRIYWGNSGANKISFANLDGSGGRNLNTSGATVSSPTGLAIDPAGGRVYWANQAGNEISFANLDGSGGGDLNTSGATVDTPEGVAVDPVAGKIYWANFNGNEISFANLNGSGGGDIWFVPGPSGVAVDPAAGKIYFARRVANKISSINVGGSDQTDLVTTGATVSDPTGVAVDPAAGRVYWGNNVGNKVSFANLNGSGGGDLNTTGATVNGPRFPSLLKAPSGTGAPTISGRSTVGSQLSCSQGSWASDLLSEFLYRSPQSVAYQWSLGGADIAGATASSITANAPGDYRCRVTATNHAGSAAQASDPHAVVATLTVSVAGTGTGTVSASGISCPGDCSELYAAATAVTLTAKAASGSSFAGWGGACSGTGACTVTMSSEQTVTATFTATPTPAAPVLRGLNLSPRKVSIAGRKVKGRCIKHTKTNSTRRPCRRAIKLTVSYTLSIPARVKITVQGRAPGRNVNGRCVKQTKTNRKHKRCTLRVTLQGSLTQSAKAGANSFVWDGKLGGNELGPGSYTLVATPGSNRQTGSPRTVPFTITS
jgi:hypothetical protein